MSDAKPGRPRSDFTPQPGVRGCDTARRQMLAVSLAALLGGPWLLRLASGAAPASGSAASRPAALSPEQESFLRFSQAMTGHGDLNPVTAGRIYDAMRQASADFPGQAAKLAGLAGDAAEPESLLRRATEAGLRETALAVVAAWYTGSVGADSRATVVAYRDALMYRPVQDAQTVPTYCNYGPAWWVADPPPIGVSPPVERPGPEAPTTGFPVPTTRPPAPPRSTPQGAPSGGGR